MFELSVRVSYTELLIIAVMNCIRQNCENYNFFLTIIILT